MKITMKHGLEPCILRRSRSSCPLSSLCDKLIHLLLQVVPLVNGQMAIIRGIDRCTELIDVGKTVLRSTVSADIVPGRPGLELVLGADDGTLPCLGNAPNTSTDRYELTDNFVSVCFCIYSIKYES